MQENYNDPKFSLPGNNHSHNYFAVFFSIYKMLDHTECII